jgi:hypothetical protein
MIIGTEENFWPLQNTLLDKSRVLNSKYPKRFLLSRRTKTKEKCFLCKCKEAHLMALLFENYELSFRQTNDLNGLSTAGLREVCIA